MKIHLTLFVIYHLNQDFQFIVARRVYRKIGDYILKQKI